MASKLPSRSLIIGQDRPSQQPRVKAPCIMPAKSCLTCSFWRHRYGGGEGRGGKERHYIIKLLKSPLGLVSWSSVGIPFLMGHGVIVHEGEGNRGSRDRVLMALSTN